MRRENSDGGSTRGLQTLGNGELEESRSSGILLHSASYAVLSQRRLEKSAARELEASGLCWRLNWEQERRVEREAADQAASLCLPMKETGSHLEIQDG